MVKPRYKIQIHIKENKYIFQQLYEEVYIIYKCKVKIN